MPYCVVLWRRLKKNKNRDENPNLPMDFKQYRPQIKSLSFFCQMFVIAKREI